MIIVCHLFVSIYLFIQAFNNFNFWYFSLFSLLKRDPAYIYSNSYIYYDTFKGMIGVSFVFGLCGYYGSLCHSIISLCQVYNARRRLGKLYIIIPIVFAFICMVISTFILQDTGIKDFLVDGITDGSLSELLHIVVIFILVPYMLYSTYVVYQEQNKLSSPKSQQQLLVESGVLADKELFTRHIKYMIVFMVTVLPGCFAELLPLLWKTIPRSATYHLSGNIAAICFSLAGLGISIVRLNDPYVKEKIQLAIAGWFGAELREVSIEVVDAIPEIVPSFINDDNHSETSSIVSLNANSSVLHQSTQSIHSFRPRGTTIKSPRKTIFEQVQDKAVYEVFFLWKTYKKLGYFRFFSWNLLNDRN